MPILAFPPREQNNPLEFRRPSRSGGPEHVITADRATLRPLACTCAAFRNRDVCHAVLAVVVEDLYWLAWGVYQLAAQANEDLTEVGRILRNASRRAHAAEAILEQRRGCRRLVRAA